MKVKTLACASSLCLWLPLAAAAAPPPDGGDMPDLELLEFLGEWGDGSDGCLDPARLTEEAAPSIWTPVPVTSPSPTSRTTKESEYD